MLGESLTVVAAALGTAVVQAAGTQAWEGMRGGIARVLGRGRPERESVELEWLDRTAGALEAAGPAHAESERIRQETVWGTRLATLLEGLPERERQGLVDALETVLRENRPSSGEGGAGGVVHGNTFYGTAFVQGSGTQIVNPGPRG
ncbi:hypothetical protein [Streptomyces fradiae]|uniref:hypothetical protein n=1 Tax=Streptomyces fradiae TaxID=1906 RepID=UPI002942CA5F|nr:hypothetical protein [Streptomyces fradiae]WOI61816.1 hypothetical protein RYQ63_18985 [Streptomyces fradiae]